MFGSLTGFHAEPAAIAEAIRLGLVFAALMGWVHLDEGQKLALLAFISALLSVFVRQSVVSQNTLQQAGLSKAIVVARAEDPAIAPLAESEHKA